MAKENIKIEEYDVNEDSLIRRAFACDHVKSIDEDKRQISFIISTDRVDRMGDIITVSGWQLKEFRKNPVVLFAHNSRVPPIGKAVKISKIGGALESIAQFMERDMSEFADSIYQMYIGGYMRAVSVGFKPLAWDRIENEDGGFVGYKFTKQELLEFSAVPIPANPDALMNARSAGIDTQPIKKWAEQVIDEWDNGDDTHILERCGLGFNTVEGIYKDASSAVSTPVTLEFEDKAEDGFKIQSVLGKKKAWGNKKAFMSWAKNHSYRTDKVDETDSYWRLRQRNPGDFKRLRTICINPGDASPSSDNCKVLATGGPMKSLEDMQQKSEVNAMFDDLPVASKEEIDSVDEILIDMVNDGEKSSAIILEIPEYAAFDIEFCEANKDVVKIDNLDDSEDDVVKILTLVASNGMASYGILGTNQEGTQLIGRLLKAELDIESEATSADDVEDVEDEEKAEEEDKIENEDDATVEASETEEDNKQSSDVTASSDDDLVVDFKFVEEVLDKFEEFLDEDKNSGKGYNRAERRKIKYISQFLDELSTRLLELIGEAPEEEEGRSSEANPVKSNGHDESKKVVKLSDVQELLAILVPKEIDKAVKKRLGRLD